MYPYINVKVKKEKGKYCTKTCNIKKDKWNKTNEGIPRKINQKSLGIYTEYDGDEGADYTIIAACEVEPDIMSDSFIKQCDKLAENIKMIKIPAGKYAKFVVKGNMKQAVTAVWQEIWSTELPRSFVCDFEEYQNEDMEQAEIHIYIGLTE